MARSRCDRGSSRRASLATCSVTATSTTSRPRSWRTTEGAVAHGAREVRALDPGRCAVRLDLEVTPTGVNRILAPLLGRMLARNLTGDVERLRTLVEQLPEAVTA